MADENLAHIYLTNNTQSLLRKSKNSAPDIYTFLDSLCQKVVIESCKFAQFGYQSVVPIDTGELRNQFIKTRINKYSGYAYVRDGSHRGADRKVINSISLIDILNSGVSSKSNDLRRSRNSSNISSNLSSGISFDGRPARSSTKGWIQDADKQITDKFQTFLSNSRF